MLIDYKVSQGYKQTMIDFRLRFKKYSNNSWNGQ